MCLDCDPNLLQLYRAEKLPHVVKYITQSLKMHDLFMQQQARCLSESEGSSDRVAAVVVTEEAIFVRRLSHLLPTEVWAVALATFGGPNCK